MNLVSGFFNLNKFRVVYETSFRLVGVSQMEISDSLMYNMTVAVSEREEGRIYQISKNVILLIHILVAKRVIVCSLIDTVVT